MPHFIYFFANGQADAGKELLHLVGGKGASLGEMTRAGLNVPPGFTISAECCDLYFRNNRAWPAGLEEQVREYLGRLEQIAGRRYGQGSEPLLVSVRSGAAQSMPGMMDTVLNVGLKPDPWEELRGSINAVFESWNTDRAVAYRQHHHITGLLGTAVTVQLMCPAEVSGVMFTANPVDPAHPQIIIEAAHGLGEALVLGQVTPDRFVLDKSSLAILERKFAPDHPAASLNDTQLVELARLGLSVEAHFQMPCDIEWALYSGQFYLLQSRAIKGLEDARLIEEVRKDNIDTLRQLAGNRRIAWVIHNLAETLPAPTPMTWDIIRRFMSGNGGYGLMYQDLGFRPSERVKKDGFLDLVCGRIYLNTDRHAELFWESLPVQYDIDLILREPGRAEAMPTQVDQTRMGCSTLLMMPVFWWRALRQQKTTRQLQADFDKQFSTRILPPFLQYVQERRQQDLSKLDGPGLLRELERRIERVLSDFGREAIKLSYLGGLAHTMLNEHIKSLLPDKGPDLLTTLSSGLDNDRTVEANIRLTELARGQVGREKFFEEFGHRATQEFELSQPRWREEPAVLDAMLDNLRANPETDPRTLHQRMKDRREAAERSLPAPGLADYCDRVRRYLPYRETAKHYLLMGYELIRLLLLEIDRRHQLNDGVFYLRHAELPELLNGRDFKEEIAHRRARHRAELRVHVPDVVTTDDLEAIGRPVSPADLSAETWQGTPVAPGSGTGPAAVVFDPIEARGLTRGYVLVCPSTDPGWTPLFINAAALVMERGGVLSHGAVVARDLGIPAVVIKEATTCIKNGESIRVDGNTGSAYRVKK